MIAAVESLSVFAAAAAESLAVFTAAAAAAASFSGKTSIEEEPY